jgi:hypothetical protein
VPGLWEDRHSALRCYKRFDASYNGDEKQEHVVTTSYYVDTNWYTDTGASDHISELDKLMKCENITVLIKCMQQMDQVCPFLILVTLPFIAVIEILSLRIFFMCQMHLKILFQYTSLHMIMMHFLNFILGIFL